MVLDPTSRLQARTSAGQTVQHADGPGVAPLTGPESPAQPRSCWMEGSATFTIVWSRTITSMPVQSAPSANGVLNHRRVIVLSPCVGALLSTFNVNVVRRPHQILVIEVPGPCGQIRRHRDLAPGCDAGPTLGQVHSDPDLRCRRISRVPWPSCRRPAQSPSMSTSTRCTTDRRTAELTDDGQVRRPGWHGCPYRRERAWGGPAARRSYRAAAPVAPITASSVPHARSLKWRVGCLAQARPSRLLAELPESVHAVLGNASRS